MSQINGIITHTFGTSGGLRAIETQQNTKVNSILFDIRFTPTAEYIANDKFSVFKKVFCDLNLRNGSGSGSSELIIDNVPLYQILQYSDLIAGVSVNATSMTANQEFRISGELPLGYFGLDANDSLDIELYCSEQMPFDVSIDVSTIYTMDKLSLIYKYSTSKPTGSDQSYTNVIGAYIDTSNALYKTCTIRDEVNDQSTIQIESAIAHTNAVGNFEVFTRFGQIYEDVYGVGQNITLKVPTDNADTEILLVGYIYNTDMLVKSAGNFQANKELLMTKISNRGGDKAEYLRALGLIS